MGININNDANCREVLLPIASVLYAFAAFVPMKAAHLNPYSPDPDFYDVRNTCVSALVTGCIFLASLNAGHLARNMPDLQFRQNLNQNRQFLADMGRLQEDENPPTLQKSREFVAQRIKKIGLYALAFSVVFLARAYYLTSDRVYTVFA